MLAKVISRNGHFIKDRKTEAIVAIVITVIGLCLLWDAFDGRGKKLPWPASGLTPW